MIAISVGCVVSTHRLTPWVVRGNHAPYGPYD